MNVLLQIEAVLFTSENPVSIEELFNSFINNEQAVSEDEIRKCIQDIRTKYQSDDYAFEIVNSGGGYQFLSKADYHEWISKFLNQKANKKLSTAAMETLSIIAYKQPVTKSEIEQIRGVSADYTVHKLLEKELINISGKADSPGKPILYSVSPYFLDYFGINSTSELPQLKDVVPQNDNALGEGQ